MRNSYGRDANLTPNGNHRKGDTKHHNEKSKVLEVCRKNSEKISKAHMCGGQKPKLENSSGVPIWEKLQEGNWRCVVLWG